MKKKLIYNLILRLRLWNYEKIVRKEKECRTIGEGEEGRVALFAKRRLVEDTLW